MLLSIIIPYYNGEQWIEMCLNSLLNQDIPESEYEIIVVNDGSTHSVETLTRYVNAHHNIHFLCQENKRHAAVRNYGLATAKGDYVFFCDCDDYVEENVFGGLYHLAQSERLDILLFNYKFLQEGEKVKIKKRDFNIKQIYPSGLEYMSQPPYKFSGGVWQFLVRREFLIEKNIQFASELFMCEEKQFFLQMVQVAGRMAKVDVDVYYYVQRPASWVHKEGKVKNCNSYVESIITYVQYLNQVRQNLIDRGDISEGCLLKMQNQQAKLVLSAILILFRYSTLKDNRATIKHLKILGYYPLNHKLVRYDWLRRFVNNYPLWMMLYFIFHLQPLSLRKRLY